MSYACMIHFDTNTVVLPCWIFRITILLHFRSKDILLLPLPSFSLTFFLSVYHILSHFSTGLWHHQFYEHSYGSRPNRNAENAVAYMENRIFIGNLYYVVDVDIKGFFDNVNHKKLLRQLWTLGIRDTKLLQIIKAMLKAPICMPDGATVFPDKGTPQGGILSPLLANVVLNELDWWVVSQWEQFSDHMRRHYKPKFNFKESETWAMNIAWCVKQTWKKGNKCEEALQRFPWLQN